MMEIFGSVLVALITALFGPVVLLWVKKKLTKPKDEMVIELFSIEKITTEIEEVLQKIGGDRVWITQFHNGGHFYPTGKSMAKFSVIYESVAPSVNSIQLNFQNIPVNLFSKSINQLYENDVIEISDFKDDTISTFGLKYIAEDTGCKSGFLFAIKTIDDKFIGTLGIDYTKRKTKLDMESINHLQVHATAIGGVLMGHLNG